VGHDSEGIDKPEDDTDLKQAPIHGSVGHDNYLESTTIPENWGTSHESLYQNFAEPTENQQSKTIQTACTGCYLQSGTTCYVYQPVPNFNTEPSGNLIYYQMPCYNYIDTNYQYVSPDVVLENAYNTTDSCAHGETANDPNTFSVDCPPYLMAGDENKENGVTTTEEVSQSVSCNRIIDASEQQHIESSCHFPQSGESDEESVHFSPNQTSHEQQPLNTANSFPFTASEGFNNNFQYPAMNISQSGLITILLRCDVSVEMTLDRAVRLVSHQKNLVVASSATNDSNFITHSAGVISHRSSVVEADIYLRRRIKMEEEDIIFGNANKSYKFNHDKISVEATPDFAKLSKNSSVSILFSSKNSSDENLVESCLEVVTQAQYLPLKHKSGGYVININNIKVIQNGKGEVKVVCPDKYMRVSPTKEDALLRIKNVIELGIEPGWREVDWRMWINHGQNFMRANRFGLVLCNGSIEAGVDTNGRVRACRIPSGIPIFIGEDSSLPKRRYFSRARRMSRKEYD
jgi:hypothetical protein